MAATSITSLLSQVRAHLIEPAENFWTDDELVDIMYLGACDLWGGILDLHQDHYFRVNNSTCVLKAGATEIDGLPEDCFRIRLIEPRDTTVDGSGHRVMFTPKKYGSVDFSNARTQQAIDPGNTFSRQVFFQVTGLGPPIEPPKILTAPKLTADLPLSIAYNPTLPKFAKGDANPVPGSSDNALKAWTIAYARAKETDDKTPDAGWLGVYSTEKQLILVRLTPREEQDPEVVEDLFQGYGSNW